MADGTPTEDGTVVTIEGHKRRKAVRAAQTFLASAIAARDEYAAQEDALEAELGRFFRMEQDFEIHGQVPYLLVAVILPRRIDQRERAAWERRGAFDFLVVGHLAKEHPDSSQTNLAPGGTNQFWTSRISLKLTPEQALALMAHPDRPKVAKEFGKLRVDETHIGNVFDMAGMRRFEIEKHPAYGRIFGDAGRCFEILVSNRHPDPARPPMSIEPWRYGFCRNTEDVEEAIRLIAKLERKAALAGADNVVDLTEPGGALRP